MEDTVQNRMKAIEAIICAGGLGEDLDIWLWRSRDGQDASAEKMKELLKTATEAIGDIYRLSHGYNAECCKGKGAELIEPAIKSYF